MNQGTVIIHLQGGCVLAVQSTNPSVTRFATVADGEPERVAVVRRPITDDEITRALRTLRACELSGAWHGLDGAADEAAASLAAVAEACLELAEHLRGLAGPRQPRRDPAALLADLDALEPARSAARQVLAAGPEALDALDAVCARAAEIIAADDAAHQGRPQLASAQ